MQPPVSNAFLDRIDATIMGVHGGLPPTLLAPQQLAWAVNVTNRGGHPRTRPSIRKLVASYADDDSDVNATEALFQGASFHRSFGSNQNCLLASIGGRIFRYLPASSSVMVDDISANLPTLNDPTRPQAWLFQGQDFTIINDNQSLPLFYDGASLRRSQGAAGNELPPGKMGHYANGRIAMALQDTINGGTSWIAGDLVYSTVSGTAQYNYRDSILKTTENKAILGGRAFAVPITAGPITSMFSVAIPDTSLGQGPLQIGTRGGIFSVNLPLDATLWTTTQQPNQTVSLPNGGPTSFYGVATVNGDAWYRAADGLRTFVTARRDFNTWVQTPLSFEMTRILSYDTQSLLDHASSVNFSNRLIATCSPYRVAERGVAHRGLVALDFNNISSLTVRSNPSYDGLWTGLPILQLVNGEFNGTERCFIFALDADRKICLYELLDDGASWFDFDGSEDVEIESWIESGALFGRETDQDRIKQPLKRLITADVYLEDIRGQCEITAQYRSDQWPFWLNWANFSVCAEVCSPTCPTFEPPQAQYATYQRLSEPPDNFNPITGQKHRTGYYFQCRLMWSGYLELHRMDFWSQPTIETANVARNIECKLIKGCPPGLFTYSIE